MKVLHVTKKNTPIKGGIERVMEELSNGLQSNGIESKQGYYSGFIDFLQKSKNFDLIHLHGFRSITPSVWLAAKLNGKKIVFTPHLDFDFSTLNQKVLLFAHRFFSPDAVIALTQTEKKILEKKGFENISVIPNAVNLKKFKPLPANDFRKKFCIPKNALIVLFAGRLAANKGIPVLIKAFAQTNAKNKFLVIAGREDKRFADTTYEYYEKMLKETGLKKNALIAKELSEADLVKAFNSCDALVLPSTASEAFGLVLIEAMACKKAVIGTNLETVKEVIDSNKNGFIVQANNATELKNAMEKLLKNKNLRKEFGENGFRKAKQNYALEKIVSEHRKVYDSLL